MAKILIPPETRELLRKVMIFEEDLIGALAGKSREAVPDEPGAVKYRCQIPIPRPLDPETAEMRALDVFLRPASDDSWEIYAVGGLDDLLIEE